MLLFLNSRAHWHAVPSIKTRTCIAFPPTQSRPQTTIFSLLLHSRTCIAFPNAESRLLTTMNSFLQADDTIALENFLHPGVLDERHRHAGAFSDAVFSCLRMTEIICVLPNGVERVGSHGKIVQILIECISFTAPSDLRANALGILCRIAPVVFLRVKPGLRLIPAILRLLQRCVLASFCCVVRASRACADVREFICVRACVRVPLCLYLLQCISFFGMPAFHSFMLSLSLHPFSLSALLSSCSSL